mgnify:CR=1 FL=1
MTIRAYNELYLNDAQTFLANFFDYALCDCKLEPEFLSKIFVNASLSREFERGNPGVLSGKSGVEAARELIGTVMPNYRFPDASFSEDRSSAYWAGWALAYYQWQTVRRFKDIFVRVPLADVLAMYRVFHEMDLSNFVEAMETRYNAVVLDTKLKKIREARGLSQQELSDLSGVKIRSIQLYEQKVNDIDKAQAQTLYKLARVLGCNMEDLLERPEEEL